MRVKDLDGTEMEHFGEKALTTHRCTVRLPIDIWKESRIAAFKAGMDYQDLVAEALRQFLERLQCVEQRREIEKTF